MSVRTSSSLVGIAMVVAASWSSAQGLPAAPRDAQPGALIDEGIRLRGERRDEDALAQFRRAWEIGRSPEALAQIALAEQALGRWVEAERDLVTAATSASDSWIARNRAHLDAALAEIRQHLGTLEIRSRTTGARAMVNGRDEGTLPLASPLRVVVGTATVEVSAPGNITARRVLDVHPGDELLEEFELVAQPPATEAAAPGASRVSIVPRRRALDTGVHPARALGVGLAIGAGVFAVGGVTAVVWHEVAANDFNAPRAQPCLVDPAMPDVVHGAPECASLRTQSDTATALTIAGFVTAGALAAGGLVLLLTTPSSQRRAVAGCAPGLLSLTCRVAF